MDKANVFLPNNMAGFGITVSGDLNAKYGDDFEKMPLFGTRNIYERSTEVKTGGEFLNISIRCNIPYGLCMFTKVPMSLILENNCFSLSDIFRQLEINELAEKLQECLSDMQRLTIIESFLVPKIINKHPPIFVEIVKFIHETQGLFNVAYIARKFSITERSINRYFSKYVGIGPISYINLVRFRTMLNIGNGERENLLSHALEVGYYDQSHFIMHFKEFGSMQLLREL